jgi:hypothetical protein
MPSKVKIASLDAEAAPELVVAGVDGRDDGSEET